MTNLFTDHLLTLNYTTNLRMDSLWSTPEIVGFGTYVKVTKLGPWTSALSTVILIGCLVFGGAELLVVMQVRLLSPMLKYKIIDISVTNDMQKQSSST